MNNLVWSVRPEIFELGSISVRWYGLCFALGFLVGNQLATLIFRREKYPDKILSSLFSHVMVGTIVGARLGHCLLYEPTRYLSDPISILNLREGGLASHGGFLGVLLSLAIFLRRHREFTFLQLCDLITMPALVGAIFIRIGNFFNSEMYGPTTSLPWGIVFTSVDSLPRHPAMLYEAFAYSCVLLTVAYLYWKHGLMQRAGALLGAALTLGFFARFIIEFLKVDQVEFEKDLFLNMGQLLSLPFIFIGLYLVYTRCFSIDRVQDNIRDRSS